MALLRHLMINYSDRVQKIGIENVKKFISILEIVLYIWCSLWSLVVYLYTSSPMTMTFCYDQSVTFLDMLVQHSNSSTDQTIGKWALTFISMFLQSLGILEFIMYFIMFKTLRNKDENLKKNIGKDSYQKRTKRNVMNLTGQAFGFAIEMICMIISHVLIRLDTNSPFLQPQMAPYYVVVASTIVSIGQFMTSPDMRKFYLKTEF